MNRVREGEKERERERESEWFGLINLFNGISTPYRLFNAEIWFIRKWWIVIITIFSMFHCISLNFKFRFQSFVCIQL